MGSEETSEVTKVGTEVCQERLLCQVSGSRAVNRKNVRERKTSRQTAGKRKGCHGGYKPTWEFKASSQYDAFRDTK